MIIKKITDKYILWDVDGEIVLTNRKTKEIYRGTEQQCNAIIKEHPYGMTISEIEAFKMGAKS